jgi:hypothetical protein
MRRKKGCGGRKAPPHPFLRTTLPSPKRGGDGGGVNKRSHQESPETNLPETISLREIVIQSN